MFLWEKHNISPLNYQRRETFYRSNQSWEPPLSRDGVFLFNFQLELQLQFMEAEKEAKIMKFGHFENDFPFGQIIS